MIKIIYPVQFYCPKKDLKIWRKCLERIYGFDGLFRYTEFIDPLEFQAICKKELKQVIKK